MVLITRFKAALIVISFVFLDLLACSILFVKNDQIFYRSNGSPFIRFDLRLSQVDHCGLSVLRTAILLGALIGVCYKTKIATKRLSSWSIYAICIFLALLVYSPFKLLTLAESTMDFRLPWFWTLFAWNILASTTSALIWLFVLSKVQIKETEEQPKENKNDTISSELVEHRLIYGADSNQLFEHLLKNNEEKNEEKNDLKRLKEQAKQTTSTMWRLIKYCKDEWMWYLLGFIFLICYSTARIFIPYFTGRVISDIVVHQSYDRLRTSVLIMSLLALGSSIFAGLRSGAFQYAIAKMSTRSRKDLFASMVRQEIGFFDMTKTGDITSRLAADCQAMSDTISTNVNVFLRSAIMLVGTLVFMFKLCWQMTVMTFIAIPLIAVVSKVYGMYYERLSKQAQDSLARANEVAEEVISSMRTVRSFANEECENQRYNVKLTDVLKVRTKQTYAFIGYTWINELVDLILLIAVLWYGGHLVLTGKLRSEDLIAYLLYQLQLGEALINIGWVFTGLMQAVGASQKVFEWIDRKPQIPNDGTMKTSQVAGAIEFKDVTFAYPSRPEVDVLKGINFTANPGEVVALVGPSGGGKSSCIALLEHFYEPKSGVVTIDGVSVKKFDHRFFHQKVALVGQEPVLYARSIRDNISYGLRPDEFTTADIVYVSELANAHHFIVSLPKNYQTDVGEKGVQLSGGQKQRIAIARALIRKPKVLLLDEATSALDAESEYLVQQAIHQNLAGHTVILIAHRLSTVEKADKIVVIDGGRVVQEGTHADLLAQEGIYRNLVHRQLIGDHGLQRSNALSLEELECRKLLHSMSVTSAAGSPQEQTHRLSISPVKHFPPEK